MRNLIEYPITIEEMIQAVKEEYESYVKCLEAEPMICGDIHGIALQETIKFLQSLEKIT